MIAANSHLLVRISPFRSDPQETNYHNRNPRSSQCIAVIYSWALRINQNGRSRNVITRQRTGAAYEWRRHLGVYYFSCRKRNPWPYLAPNRSLSPTDIYSSIRVFHLPYNGSFFPRDSSSEMLFNGARKMASQCIRRHTKATPFSETPSLCVGVCMGKTAIFCHFRCLSLTQAHAIVVCPVRLARIRLSFLPVASEAALCLHIRQLSADDNNSTRNSPPSVTI